MVSASSSMIAVNVPGPWPMPDVSGREMLQIQYVGILSMRASRRRCLLSLLRFRSS
jgi:hypothetical protein